MTGLRGSVLIFILQNTRTRRCDANAIGWMPNCVAGEYRSYTSLSNPCQSAEAKYSMDDDRGHVLYCASFERPCCCNECCTTASDIINSEGALGAAEAGQFYAH